MNASRSPCLAFKSVVSRRAFLSLTALSLLVFLIADRADANPNLAYSFETGLQGYGPNGFGTTVTQDTIGATDGANSMKVAIIGGATFVGALTSDLDPTIFGDPPGLDQVLFDLTITQRFDIPNPTPPPDRLGFARVGVTVFGKTQPDFPGGQITGLGAQIEDRANTEVAIGSLEPGTYRNLRIPLTKMGDPLDFSVKSFNEIFGVEGSGSDLIPTSFQLYFNKSGGDAFPLTVYVDNIRFASDVPGDYSGNFAVDAADYPTWRKNNGNAFQLKNEVAGVTPGQVTLEDYIAWRERFGSTTPSSGSGLGAGNIPEPTSAMLLVIATTLFGFGIRKRRITP